MASEWQALEVKLPGKDLLEQVRSTLETLVTFMEVIKALLETISVFLIDFGNPIRALVEALLQLILQLFESLKQTGLYGWFDIPDPAKDPNFHAFKGGYQKLTERFKNSLFDSRDPFRPQPIPNLNKSGFVLIVADAETIFGLLRLVKILMKFFGRELLSARFTTPANCKVFPAGTRPGALGGTNYDPILQVASIFGADLKGLAIEWSLATNQFPPDPGFTDLLATVSSELIPHRWLIEKTSVPSGPETVTVTAETNFESKRGSQLKRKVKVRDENGDYFRKFEKYIVIDPSSSTGTFFLGQLGTFRYIDTEVEKGKNYQYRVRGFSGGLKVNTDGTLPLEAPVFDSIKNEYVQRWPSLSTTDPPIMGFPSAIMHGRVPNLPTDFDVLLNLENSLRMAFALGFHLELSDLATFDDEGRNTGSTPSSEIGKGSLTNMGGPISQIIPAVSLGFINPKSTSLEAGAVGGVGFSESGLTSVTTDPTSGSYPDVTHNFYSVKAHAARLASAIGSALLDNSAMLYPLKDLMYSLPRPVPEKGYFKGVTNLQGMVAAFNTLPDQFPKVYDADVYLTYQAAFSDPDTRLNVLDIIRFIKNFTLGGTPPDWISISLLRDVIPWSGQFIYDLLNRMEALLDAFKSAVDEIKAFIDTLVRKIEVLERFVKFLIDILSYLDSFSAGFYFLNVPSTDQGINGWIQALDESETRGTPPPSGPGGYSAGVALAYSATDVTAFVKAFGIIF
jgi:hypothetical protein